MDYKYLTDYEAVATGQSDQVLGPNGAAGDILERLVITVSTAASSTVSIKDGNGSGISIMAANTAIGVYSINIGARAVNTTSPGWKVTTGAGASVVAIGYFK